MMYTFITLLAVFSVAVGIIGRKKSSNKLPANVFMLADMVAKDAENMPAINSPGSPGIPCATSVTYRGRI